MYFHNDMSAITKVYFCCDLFYLLFNSIHSIKS